MRDCLVYCVVSHTGGQTGHKAHLGELAQSLEKDNIDILMKYFKIPFR